MAKELEKCDACHRTAVMECVFYTPVEKKLKFCALCANDYMREHLDRFHKILTDVVGKFSTLGVFERETLKIGFNLLKQAENVPDEEISEMTGILMEKVLGRIFRKEQ